MTALEFFAKKVGDRRLARLRAGLPLDPPLTREEVMRRAYENMNRPNALLERLGLKSGQEPK